LEAVQERIKYACDRSGRSTDSVRLVAVSKRHPPEQVREIAACGQTLFGESRVQEAEAKIAMCPAGLDWHLIGHLQRNKVRKAVALFSMIHSVDSSRLIDSINTAAVDCGRIISICIEVNVSGEPSKYGVTREELPDVLEYGASLKNVDIVGLMTMAPWSENPENARPHFEQLRKLKEKCENEWRFPMNELSMGMSGDFDVAIEEGATLVRVGTDIFGER
jgi:hypothetical protein